MTKRAKMLCCLCGKNIDKADHIALNDFGDIVVICDKCYDTAKIFFKRRNKSDAKS